MNDCYIIDAVRTPIGKYGGRLSSIRPDDLLAHVITALLNRNPVDVNEIEDVIAQDDMESARTIVNVIHTATGKNVSFSGICMVRVKDGKIADAWNNYDFLNMYQQLGQNLIPLEV